MKKESLYQKIAKKAGINLKDYDIAPKGSVKNVNLRKPNRVNGRND